EPPGRVSPNLGLSAHPPHQARFYGDHDPTIDIPLDTAKDVKRKEAELEVREAEPKKREQALRQREEAAARGTILSSTSLGLVSSVLRHSLAFGSCRSLSASHC
ncbi:hypothetical protein GW17_00000301, partial [Ensete ventricosum]